MSRLTKRWPLYLAALLALCCGLCLWRLWAVSRLLDSQRAAERWKGSGERNFAQISCLLPPVQSFTLDDVYKFRNDMYQKLKGAGYDIEAEKGLYDMMPEDGAYAPFLQEALDELSTVYPLTDTMPKGSRGEIIGLEETM